MSVNVAWRTRPSGASNSIPRSGPGGPKYVCLGGEPAWPGARIRQLRPDERNDELIGWVSAAGRRTGVRPREKNYRISWRVRAKYDPGCLVDFGSNGLDPT